MIKQPNVILGNKHLLVTMGSKGEIFGFFYPRKDYAQNVEESVACIHDGERLMWTDSGEWTANQYYIKDTDIVSTKLSHESGLEVSILDFLHPEAPFLIRKYRIYSDKDFHGKFFYYLNLNTGEMEKKNSAFCDPEEKMFVQYWRDFHIGLVGLPGFDDWQVGKIMGTIWWMNAKYDMEDGILQKNREDIGKLNSALGWKLDVNTDDPAEITLLIGASKRRTQLYKRMHEIYPHSIDDMYENTKNNCFTWLSGKRKLNLSGLSINEKTREQLLDMYNRSLLTLNLLNDSKHGSFVAAPEFDSNFEMCGGYGFCWNRDASEVATSLLNSGYHEYCEHFLKWCKKTQFSDGSWFQRYWIDGNIAPAWCNFSDSTQIDETGSTLQLANLYYQSIGGVRKADFLYQIWVTVLHGAEYLMKRSSEGLHDLCIDLWETYKGVFSYTNASIYAGLLSAAHLAEEYNELGLAKRWSERAEQVKRNTLDKLWLDDGYFAKGIIDNNLDTTVDVSILGTFVPFNMLNPKNPDEKQMIDSMIAKVEEKLALNINEYYGIKRYENDNYIGGNPWIVATLWLSKSILTLATSINKKTEQQQLIDKALEYIKWSIRGTTSAGLLPEQVDKYTGNPAWVIPLGWSCSLMIDNLQLLDSL
ncbi:glycoside hydrolase family 15 protein [Methanohalobium sp.]|uniref:glycoside hydrolase family 15 protein n=1 Tax=Methanohalobium sp. TaxID=2837493 RepID=UPI0025CE1C20|nr:glycoside hydrolase family 15 protein [Methanohalobium sp.]